MIDFNLDIDIIAELENINFKSNNSNSIYYISSPLEIILPMVRFPFKKMKNKIKLELENPNRNDIKLQSFLLFYELLTNKFCEKTFNSNINNLLYKNKGYTNLTLYNKNLPYFDYNKFYTIKIKLDKVTFYNNKWYFFNELVAFDEV